LHGTKSGPIHPIALPLPPHTTDQNNKKLTSFAVCCIFISLSISTSCCSSEYASAHGTPSSSALVLTTHSALPPNARPLFSRADAEFSVETRKRRWLGGMMSCRAWMRSASDSSSGMEEVMEEASDSVRKEAEELVGGIQERSG